MSKQPASYDTTNANLRTLSVGASSATLTITAPFCPVSTAAAVASPSAVHLLLISYCNCNCYNAWAAIATARAIATTPILSTASVTATTTITSSLSSAPHVTRPSTNTITIGTNSRKINLAIGTRLVV